MLFLHDEQGKISLWGWRHPETEITEYMFIYNNIKPNRRTNPMKLLSPKEVADITGLPYIKALALVKSTNHIQIDNRYYVSETVLRAFLNPDTALKITTI